jgi:hypothetical protein
MADGPARDRRFPQPDPNAVRVCRRCNGKGRHPRKDGQVWVCPGCLGEGVITWRRLADIYEGQLRDEYDADRLLLGYIAGAALRGAGLARVVSLVVHSLESRLAAFNPDRPEHGRRDRPPGRRGEGG